MPNGIELVIQKTEIEMPKQEDKKSKNMLEKLKKNEKNYVGQKSGNNQIMNTNT